MTNKPGIHPVKAIQMIGTQRSGSNLLRVMLNQLPEIYAPHPPHILMVFYPLLAYYGDLNQEQNFKMLVDDVCSYIEINPVPWANLDLPRDKIAALCQRSTLLEIFVRINEWQSIRNNKSIWLCKSLETVYFIDNFSKEDFHPFVIYLVRDGRDVAVSFMKIMIGEKHIYQLALKWKKEQELALKYLDTLAHAHDRFIILKYEDFIVQPAVYLEQICQRLGINYDIKVMDYYSSAESQRTADSGRMWENVTKPVLKDNKGKFVKELTSDEIKIFESVAGDILEKLGYTRLFTDNELLKFTAADITTFSEENDQLKKLAVQNADEEDIRKRKPQKDFIDKLKVRFNVSI